MILIAFLASASTISQPNPKLGNPIGDMRNWIRYSDFSADLEGSVRLKVLFNPSGDPEKCNIVATSGNIALEKRVCTIAFRRFRFDKSLDSQKKPVYRILEKGTHFGKTSSMPAEFASQPLMTLGVPGLQKTQRVPVILSVNKAGNVESCTASSTEKKLRLLMEAACQAAKPHWKAFPETNMSGEPIEYLRDADIELTPPE